MTALRLPLIDPRTHHSSGTGGHQLDDGVAWVAIGDSQLEIQLQECCEEIEPELISKSKIVIVPRGETGDELWRTLPICLAALAADPLQTAILIIPYSMQQDWLQNPWQQLVECAAHGTVSEVTIPCADRAWLPDLTPGRSESPAWCRRRIQEYRCEPFESEKDQVAVRAGLLQLHDLLDLSHQASQSGEGEGRHLCCDYWHAIMHRREPDYGNSKYWFRRVGDHPCFDALSQAAQRILPECDSPSAKTWQVRLCERGWDPLAFVDLCQVCARGDDAELTLATKRIQLHEMLLLLRQSFDDATGRFLN